MTNKFQFRIISADGKVFSDSINELYVQTKEGVVGILSGHYPLVAGIEISSFRTIKDGKTTYFAISGGILNVDNDGSYILADTFEEAKDLDKVRILSAKKRAEDKLKNLNKTDEIDIRNTEFELKKAINRLRLVK